MLNWVKIAPGYQEQIIAWLVRTLNREGKGKP
jgi:hypothetical protein